MTAFAIIVDFRLKAGLRESFRKLADTNARASMRDEPECRRFDVLEPDDRPDTILLYEIYADRAAFDAHLASAHYRDFAAASADLFTARTVMACNLVFEGGA